ncbi:MAG: YegS/Rv2252/BmrU family lipid kinase [Clostridia bacterium]|nr:YegS/Rv2252/BmrU family lipid kinase [Clostridia bacterium]
MKHIFILNQTAGEKHSREKLEQELKEINVDYEIVCTQYHEHAKVIVKEYLEKYSNEKLRFYACGGDGTVNEVSSCLANVENAEFAVIPYGTGNDFVKYFGGKEKFSNVEKIVNGNVMPIDIMKIGDNYSINICNFGFEAVVGRIANEVKLKGGKDPYGTGIKKAIFSGMSNPITVEVDGKVINGKSKMLLCTLGNGKYVGGKYKCAPRSVIDDGLIEVCLIDTITIFQFLALISKYEKGEHLELNKKYVHYVRGKNVTISSKKRFELCLDGEIIMGTKFNVEILHKAINFVVPKD